MTKNASQRAKDYGTQIAANTKTLTDFKKENEVEDPKQLKQAKWTDGLKSFASSALSSIGNAVVSAGTAMIAQQLISWGLQGIDAIVHWNDNIIAKGKEAKETILEQNQTYKDQKSQLEELQEQYTKYASGVKISGNIIKNATLSDEDFQAFLDTSNQIANLAPSMIDGWDSEGNAILKFGTDTKEANQQISDYIQLQRDVTHLSIRDNLQDEYKGVVKDAEKTGKEISNKKDQKKEADTITSGWTALKNATETDGPITFTTTAPQKEVEELLDKYKVTSLITSDVNGDTYTVDMSELSAADKNALKTSLESKEALAQGNANLIESEKLAQEAVQASKWKDLLPSLQAYVESSNMFDNMDSDVAERAKNGINTMLSNIDISKMTDQIKDAGGIDDWIDKTLIAPMTSGSKDVQKAWADLFSLEDSYGSEDSKMTVGEWSKQRNDYLKTISEGTGESFDSLAKKLGYKTDEGWTVREQINNAAARLYGKNYDRDQRAEIGSYLNGLTKDNYEIAIDLLINGDKAFSSLDEFKEKVNEAISNAKNQADEAAVSLDSMETKVSTAKSTLSSMGTILTETTSAGGVSKDNVKILSTAFKNVKDPRGIEQNVNDLFTTTSDGIKLNIDALKTFTEYQAEATDGDFEKGIKLQTKAIAEQAEETDKAWKAIAKADDKEAARATYNAEKDKLKDARDEYLSYMQSQSEWQATKKQQQELLSYYSQWQRAQSTENAGDKYNNIVAGLKNAKDAYDKGLVGTDDFKSFAALISPTGSDDRANFAENYGKAVRYLTEDKTGVNNFLDDLKSKGMASYDDASKRWSFDIDDMSKAARSMGISKEFMSANFGRLRDYGIDNNFISSTEEGIDRVQELTSALSDEQKRLEELKNTDSTNTTAITASEDKVNKYKQDLKETYDNMGDYSEDAAQTAVDNFNSAAMGVQSYQNAIENVKKNENLTEAQRTSAINQLIAKQEELAATYGTTVKELLGTDVSSLMDGIITDSASVTTALDGINKAYEEQNTDVTSLVDTLGKYTSEQLEDIDFNDGKWDTELGDAEKAVESLCEKLGLTKDQARSVIEALKEAGKLKDSASSKETTKGSWKKPQTASQMGFGDDPARAAEYTHSLEALTAAHEENDAATEKSFETLSKYNRAQLEGIKLGDGAYNVEGMEQAEDALQQIADKTQLSKDQIITALEGLGVLKVKETPQDVTQSLDKLVSKAKTAQDELSNLTGETYTFNFDTTDLDEARKQVSDLQSEVDKYKDRDGNFHSEITGGEQVQAMYKGAIAQEQNIEYNSSTIGQSDSSSDVVKAAQDFMTAKNEMDQQTQLYQNGMDNTLDKATEKANAAFESLQQAQTDSGIELVDTNNIQKAENQLLSMTDKDLQAKIDVQADTSDAEAELDVLEELDGSTLKLTCELSDEDSFERAKSAIESMPANTVTTVDMEVNGEEDVEKATELIESAPTDGTELVVNCHVDNAEDLDKINEAAATAKANGANIKINATVGEVDASTATSTEPVKMTGEIESAEYTGAPVEIEATANITDVTGKDVVDFNPTVNTEEVDNYQPDDKDAEVKFEKNSDDVDNYQPTDKDATAYYGVDSSAPDSYQPADKHATVVYDIVIGSGGSSTHTGSSGGSHGGSGGSWSTGTMTSIAHADGTMYNAPWNYQLLSSAFAKGDAALHKDEKALVNEVGTESIVRDGTWFTIPGGAHLENLKKGDIIFSAQQTKDLLEHGATPGHARTYAQGTAPGLSISPAFSSGSSSSTNTELDNKIKEVSTQAKDWINVALDRLERIVEKYKDTAESDYSNYRASIKAYNSALKNLKNQLKTQKDSRAKYVTKADEVASAVGLSDDLKKKVQNGTINIENLSEDDKKRVDAYQEWYEKILDCDKAIRQLTISQKDLAKAKVDRVTEAYDTVIGKRESKAEYYKAKQELRITQGYNQKPGSIYEKYIKNELSYTNKQKKLTDKEIKTYKGKMKEYLAENGHKTVDPEYQKMKKQLYDLETSAVKLENEAAQLRQALQDNREQIKQWAVDRWERAGSKQDAVINYKTVSDDPNYQIKEKDYTERIKTNNRQIIALQKLRAEKAEYYDSYFKSGNNEEAQKYLEAIAQIDEQILKLGASTEELKNQIMELRWKPFEDIQDDLSNVISEYQTMQKLLGDTESFYNDDGSFTENGLTNILLLQESIDVTKQKIANYREALDKLDEQYKNGCYSQEEYTEKSKELLNGLQQESAALSDLQQNMLTMYETQVKTENDLLQKNIDKRLEALDAKEKYYEYDKTLKKKSKDINTLKAQIAALEGTSNAAAKARLEKLKAELAESEEDMQDTVHNHETEMKKTGFENLQSDAEKALDNTLDALKKNTNFQQAVIGNMLSNVTANYDSTYNHLHDVMDQYGVQVSTTFDKMITKSANFNTSLVAQTKAMQDVINMATKLPANLGGTATDIVNNTAKVNGTSTGAGNVTPGKVNDTTYSLKLNASEIYLTYSHLKYSLKATWSPSKPEHSDIEWSSTDKSVAKVSTSGVVTGVAAPLSKLGLMSRDESLTRKCKIIANGGPGLAKAECTVHIMPDEHYNAIKQYADKVGIDTSKEGNNLREAMEYAYKNGAFRSNQSSTAVEGFQKAYLKDWFNALPDRPNGATDVPSEVSQLAGYFYSKGKQVTRNDMQKLADILQIKTPGVGSYDTWGGTLKNKILKAYKAYGYATGGVINRLVPANMETLLGKAIISNGDQGFIGAKVGETVMTEEFTRLLKPSIAAMSDFTNMFNPTTPIATTNNDYSINNEVNINVASMSSDLDIQDVANKVSTIINKNMTRDWRKLR